MKLLFSLVLCATLAACTVLPDRVPADLYTLPSSSLPGAEGTASITGGLRLARPTTSDALGSNRVLVMTDSQSFQAFPEARWAAPIPLLWRDWLLDAYWRDGRFTGLSVSSDALRAARELDGMLRALHIERRNGQSEAVIRFDALLVDTDSRSIIASQRFEARYPANDSSVAAGVTALGNAADQLAAELIDWTASQAR